MISKKSQLDLLGEYTTWLFTQIDVPGYYNMMLWSLMAKTWTWFLDWDRNTTMHAMNMRMMYIRERWDGNTFKGAKAQDDAMKELIPDPITFLEVLVALSIQLELNAPGRSDQWARILLANLDLLQYKGNPTLEEFREIDEKVDRCIWRTYEPNGVGGFFPLKNPRMDQRKQDLWHQLNEYIHENPFGPESEHQ